MTIKNNGDGGKDTAIVIVKRNNECLPKPLLTGIVAYGKIKKKGGVLVWMTKKQRMDVY